MTNFLTSRFIPIWVASTALATQAQEPQPPTVKPAEPAAKIEGERGKWVPVFQHHADDYAITTGIGQKATRLPDPLLRWWQPIRGGDDGALYLWVRNGKPVAAVTFFTFRWPNNGDRVIIHERHSFADGPLEASWRGESAWKTTGPGLTYRPIPGAPVPGDAPAIRLRQMQAILRDFTATTTNDQKSTSVLRALPKPLYRFEVSEGTAGDGALFAMVQGTDPEVFLFLEVRGSGPSARWEYAVARFSDLEVHVQLKGQEIFHVPRALGGRDQPYFCNTVVTKRSESPDDF